MNDRGVCRTAPATPGLLIMYTLMGQLWKRRKKTIVKVNLIYFVVHLFTTYSVWSLLVWIIFQNILKQSDLITFLIFTWICIQKTPVSWLIELSKVSFFGFDDPIWSALRLHYVKKVTKRPLRVQKTKRSHPKNV